MTGNHHAISQTPLFQWVAKQVQQLPTVEVLRFLHVNNHGGLQNQSRNYAQLHTNGQRLAVGLSTLGVKPHQTMALWAVGVVKMAILSTRLCLSRLLHNTRQLPMCLSTVLRKAIA